MRSRSMILACGLLSAVLAWTGCSKSESEYVYTEPVAIQPVAPPPAPAPAKAELPPNSVMSPVQAPGGALLTKKMPEQVRLNQEFTAEITVVNTSKDTTFADVEITDRIDAGLQILGMEPRGEVMGDQVTWRMAELAPGAKQTITVRMKATQVGTLGNCATIHYVPQVCVATTVIAPELKLVKRGPANVILCDPIVYELVVTNTGSGDAKAVVVRDTLPSGVVTADGKQSVEFQAGDLAGGQSKTFKIEAKAQRAGVFTNKGTAADSAGLKAESNEVTTTVCQPQLAIDLTSTERLFAGRNYSYQVTVKNVGDCPTDNVELVATNPDCSKFLNATDGGTAAGKTITWKLGAMAPGQTKTVTARFTATDICTIDLSAEAKGDCADKVSDTARTIVEGIPAILLEVIDVEDPIEVGSNVEYQIKVTNQGTARDTNIRITAQLEQMEFVSADGPTAGRFDGTRTVTFAPLAKLDAKESVTFKIVVKAAKVGDVRFKTTLTTDELQRPVEETEATNFY